MIVKNGDVKKFVEDYLELRASLSGLLRVLNENDDGYTPGGWFINKEDEKEVKRAYAALTRTKKK